MPKRKKRKKKVNSRIKRASDTWKEWIEATPKNIVELWKLFSKFIRLRDCLKTTGTIWRGKCVTCGRVYRFNDLHAGHFIPGRMNSILFNEQAVHIQCFRCNVVLGGNWPLYYRFMQSLYGQEIIEDLIDTSFLKMNFEEKWVNQAFEYYSWAVDFMRENQQLIESDTSKIATG